MTMITHIIRFIAIVSIQLLFIKGGWGMHIIEVSIPDSTDQTPAYIQGDTTRMDSAPDPKDEHIPFENFWMYLKEKMDGSYQIIYSKQVLIHYTEPYVVADNQRLRFRVYDNHHNVVLGTDNAGTMVEYTYPVQSPLIQTGENWLTIVLGANCEYGQYYYLEVWDSKGERSYLRFKCVSIKDPSKYIPQP